MNSMQEQLLMKLIDAFSTMDDGSKEEKPDGLAGALGSEPDADDQDPTKKVDIMAISGGKPPDSEAGGLAALLDADKKKPGIF